MARSRSRAENGVLPIGIREARLAVQVGNEFDRVIHVRLGTLAVDGRAAGIFVEIGSVMRLFRHLRILVSVHQVDFLRHLFHAVVTVVGDLNRFRSAFLRGDEDHAVRTARTVDCGRRGILEHLHRFDVVRIEVRKAVLHRYAVDDVERVVAGRGRTDASHAHHHIAFGVAARLHHLHARHLAGHRLPEVRNGLIGDVFGLDRRNGRRNVAFLYGTVTDHHHIVEFRGVFRQPDFQ